MRKDLVAREITMEIVVGAFIVLVFLGIGYFTIILSRDNWFSQKHRMEFEFQDIMGLREGDNVVARGMPIGKVSRLDLQRRGVRVEAMLDQKLDMREGYSVTIVATSILGGRHLAVNEGAVDGEVLPMGTVFAGTSPRDLMGDAAEMIGALKDSLTEGGILDNVENAVADLGRIVHRLETGEGTLGRLLSEDDQLYVDLASAVASVREVTGRIAEGQGTLGRLLSEDDRLYEDLSATVASVRQTVEKVGRGEGAVGRLLNDESLYDDVRRIIEEARAAVDDMRETSPITTFTSILFGAF